MIFGKKRILENHIIGNNSSENDVLRLKIGWDLDYNEFKKIVYQIFDFSIFFKMAAIFPAQMAKMAENGRHFEKNTKNKKSDTQFF